jgi:NADH-quinone oxidoreductase subunit M
MVVTGRILVLLVVLFPLVVALLLPLFGRYARRPALLFALLHLGLTAALAGLTVPIMHYRLEQDVHRYSQEIVRFQPEYVPGDTAGKEGAFGRTRWNLFAFPPGSEDRPGPRVQLFLGVDGLNLWMVVLTSFMLIPAILASWETVSERRGFYYALLFLMQAGTIGALLAFDIILFYLFFELTLIPAFFLIGRWGSGTERREAARTFFIYTLAGSLLTLLGLLGVVLLFPDAKGVVTFSLPDLMGNVQARLQAAHAQAQAGQPEILEQLQRQQLWLLAALLAGLLVKVPVWPFHTWQPRAYTAAPIGVTIVLSAILAKLGTYGMLRIVLPLVPDAALRYGLPVVGALGAVGIVYAALCAYKQKDLKQLLAYSSISHLGLLVIGVFAFNREGLSGAILHMVNHGLTIGGLFAALAFLVERYGTTQAGLYGGLMGRYPRYAVLTFVLVLAAVGLPGLNNFVSEMLLLSGLFHARHPDSAGMGLAVVGAFGIFLSAWYLLTMLQQVFFQTLKEPLRQQATDEALVDVQRRELWAFGVPAVLCLVLGLCPQWLLDTVRSDVRLLSVVGDQARVRAGLPPPPPEPGPILKPFEGQPPPNMPPGLMPPGIGGGGMPKGIMPPGPGGGGVPKGPLPPGKGMLSPPPPLEPQP